MNKVVNTFVVVVECILEFENKILIIKRPEGVHAGGLLAFPGGVVEYTDGANETNILQHAVKREVFEEVGLELRDPLYLVTTSYFIDSHNNPVLDAIFHCVLKETERKINASPREVPEYYWLTPEEIIQHEFSPPWIKRYLSLAKRL